MWNLMATVNNNSINALRLSQFNMLVFRWVTVLLEFAAIVQLINEAILKAISNNILK